MRVPALLVSLLAVTACDRGAPSGSPAASAQASADTPPAASAAPPASASAPAAAAPEATPADAAAPPQASASAASAADAGPPAADASRLSVEGRAVQGGLLRAKLNGKLRRMAFPGHRVTVSDEGEFLIAFSRNAPAQEKLTITFDDGQVLEKVFDVEPRKFEIDKVDNLPEKMVKLDMATRVKLTQADKKLDALRNKYSKKNCYKDGFIWPTKGPITSRYGQPRLLNGTDGGIHWGVDISAPVGTPVRAPACGKILLVERDLPLSGHTIVLDHGHGLTSTFIHLHGFSVKVNDEVKQGQVIGTVGMTGRTNGAHLDWRMNLFETRVDPELLVPPGK
ncbi:peptidase [Sorangium cellulosum]|uniref:Peptidase n=1 Tax=Sorangium cellulosum TaxID=56 RepID=A0A2L0EU85_SORCE|nr:M23 family metallopeptidase [Sorangium cellulosum]AUX42856.1 peptidase [Sorangium cellulosum]